MAKRWSHDEEQHLLSLLKSKNTINDCSSILKRTPSAITSRLQKIAIELFKTVPIDVIHTITTLPIDILQIITLPNHNAEWDLHQDEWLQKYHKIYGTTECAAKMGRSVSEIERRLFYFEIEDYIKGKPVSNDKIECIEEYIALNDYDKLIEPPFYVVLNGRRKGIYQSKEGFQIATIGFKNAKYKKCDTVKEVIEYIGVEKKTTIVLSEEQEKVIEDVFLKKNVLLLGSGGTGKSTLIKELTRRCKEQHINIGITASTGSAAVLIDGKTVHSYLGIGLAKDSPTVLASTLFFKYKKKAIELKDVQILLIDEISMINAELLTKISKFLSIVRKDERLFGGLQIILSGDMYQLPPVQGSMVFNATIWDELNFTKHILTKIFRQEHDLQFQEILERSKQGADVLTDTDITILKGCKGQHFKDDIKPTCLYATNSKVDVMNTEEYEKLLTTEVCYETRYSNKESKTYCDAVGIRAFIKLKIGTQVMVTHNVSDVLKLANGTRGVVIELFNDCVIIRTLYGDREIRHVDCVNEDYKYSIMPLKLAWAITIHKAQGVTLDCCKIDIGTSLFAYGQAYTALSRVKDLNSLCVMHVSKSAFKTHPDVIAFYKRNE